MRPILPASAIAFATVARGGAPWRPSRRTFLQVLAATSVHALARRANAADVTVPIGLQSELIGKLAAFDRSFRARSGSTARLIVAYKDGDSARIGHQMENALQEMPDIAGLPKTVETFEWSSPAALVSAIRERQTALVYLSMGLDGEAPTIAAALTGTEVLTVGATGAIAERGACVGFELEEGRPRIYVNLRVAKAQKVDFSAQLLRLVKIVS
jgi:hypothetical protein